MSTQRGRLTISLVFTVAAWLATLAANAQMLQNEGNLFADHRFFNAEFIRENGIKAIKGTVASKKDLEPIRQLNLRHEYYFNRNGNLTGTLEEVAGPSGEPVALLTVYEYNQQGQLTVKRGSDRDGFFSWHYEYDAEGRVVRETYYRETGSGTSAADFEPDRKIKVFSETFEYPVDTDTQQKRVYYNRDGLEYKTRMRYRNEYGNLTEELETFTVSNRKNSNTFAYDEKHRLKTFTEQSSHGNKLVHTYSYDSLDFVQSESIVKNDQQATEVQFMYDKATYLLSARLVRDEATATIHIYEYQTEFWEEEE